MGRGHAGVNISLRGRRLFKVEKQFWRDKFLDFYGKMQDSQDFKVVGSSFQMMGAATEKARLPRFSLVLGIESCCEVDELSCLGTLEKCRRLAR